MKQIILGGVFILSFFTGRAQEQPAANSKEIGIFGQTGFSYPVNEGLSLVGLQYKKWVSPYYGYRIIAAYGNYYSPINVFSITSADDTIVEKQSQQNINLGIVGGGIEAQRRFYKRLYLFAAVELRGGYGSGSADTSLIRKTSSGNVVHSGTSVYSKGEVSMFYLGLAPSIGAKLQFKHINFGIEVSGISASFKSVRTAGHGSTGVMDMDAGSNFNHRLFLNYSF